MLGVLVLHMDLLITLQNDSFDPSRPQNYQCIAGEPRLQKLINEDPRVKKLLIYH